VNNEILTFCSINFNKVISSSLLANEIKNQEYLKVFYHSVKSDIENDDIEKLVQKIGLPFKVFINGDPKIYQSVTDFKEGYQMILTDKLKVAIQCQKFDELSSNSRGTFGARGHIWINLVYLGDSSDFEVIKNSDRSNIELWKFRITKLSISSILESYIKKCKANP